MQHNTTLINPARLNETEGRPLGSAMRHGAACRCPKCGKGVLFDGYLKTASECSACGLELSGHRADDLPAYLAVLIAGKISISAMMLLDSFFTPSVFWLTLICVAIALVSSLGLIRPIKGMVIGLQWAHEMHGFASKNRLDPADMPLTYQSKK